MIQSRDTQYSVEIDNVGLLISQTIRAIRAKKAAGESAAAIAMELATAEFGQLVAAVQSVPGLPGDLTENRTVALQTIGYRLGDIADSLL